MKRWCKNLGVLLAACMIVHVLGGCAAGKLVGGMMQADEYQKLVDTPPKYAGLENHTVAVLVDADMATLYEHPTVVAKISEGVAGRVARDVPGVRMLSPRHVLDWQYRTPQWNALPYGELTEQLNVDQIVFVTVLEYRLNPPGNRWLWEGVCMGRVGVIDRHSLDPDTFAQTFDIASKFPTETGVGRESAPQATIEYALLHRFIEKTSWLFHQHLEPKYPDKYRPELDTKKKKKTA